MQITGKNKSNNPLQQKLKLECEHLIAASADYSCGYDSENFDPTDMFNIMRDIWSLREQSSSKLYDENVGKDNKLFKDLKTNMIMRNESYHDWIRQTKNISFCNVRANFL